MSRETMKASICFHCTTCRDGLEDILLANVQLEIKNNPDLACKVDSRRVIIEGCLRTDEGEERFISGKMVCIHWKHSSSFLTKNKNILSNSTVMIQVDTPKNHFITLHCNFKEKRVVFMDSFQCTNGLEMYPELALELKHLMDDMTITLIPVIIQNEIDEGFFHSVMNSLTVESSNNTTFDMFLKEINTFQRILKINLEKREALKYQNINRRNDLKKNIKERIKIGIEIDETLEAIKDSVKTEYPQLTRDSEVYVELQYAKRVADKFLHLLPNHLKTQGSRYRMLWFQVKTISEIKDIKEPFNTVPNYEQLQKCADCFDLKAKLRFFRSFHDVCRSYSTLFSNEIEIDEKNFVMKLQNHLMKTAFNMKSASEELSQYFQDSMMKSDDKKNTKYLLKKVTETKHESLSEMRCMALKLLDCHSESFVQSVERLIKKFNEKVVTNFVTESDMNIFRCEGSFVDLEIVNTQIKSNPQSFDECTKIEIQAELYFCVNSSVKWQGKNVIIVTDTFIVDENQKHYTLDVSGKDGLPHTEKNALDGNESDRDGLAGEPGMHGESGGNVQIIAKEFNNPDNVSVISNGGSGSNGQDAGTGADGIDGNDGNGISEENFNKRFPDVSFLLGNTAGTNLRALRSENTFISKSEEIPAGCIRNGFSRIVGDYYLKGETHDHHLVEYGFWSSGNPIVILGGWLGAAMRESYCICYGQPGTPGKPGGNGGKGGSGGKGGFEGNVDIRNWNGTKISSIKNNCQSGQSGSDGKDGKGGKGGKNGKKGNDRAHVCPSQAQPTILFTGHLNIVSYEETSQERAFCPKRQKYINITTRASEYSTLHRCKDGEKGTNTKRVNNRLTESARTKKSPIVFKKIKERYIHLFCELDDGTSLQNNIETNTTMIEMVTSNYLSKLKRKVIKDNREHDNQNIKKRSHLAPIHIAKPSFQFEDMPTFENNRHLEVSIMKKVGEILAAETVETEEKISEKEISIIFENLDQISLQNSFDETHYEQLLQFIDILRNTSTIRNLEKNININYWHDKIITHLKFYLLKKTDEMTKLYIEGKKKEMDMNDPSSKTIMDDLQSEFKTMFEQLILDVLETDDVSYLKSLEQSVQKKIDDIMQEITLYTRTVSFFVEDVLMCSKKDENSKRNMEIEQPVHCSTLEHTDVLKDLREQLKKIPEIEMEIEYQIDSEFEKGTACNTELEKINEMENEFGMDSYVEIGTESTIESENLPEIEKQKQKQIYSDIEKDKDLTDELDVTDVSDHEEVFVSHDNDTMVNDFHLESQYDSDLNALIDWSISHIKSNVDICCIIKKLRYIQSENMPLIIKCLKYRLINQCCNISEEFLTWFLMSLFENEECIENGVYLRIVAAIKPENWIFEWIIQEIMGRSDVEDELTCRKLLSKVHGHKIYLFICRYLSRLEEGEMMTKSTVEVMMGTLQTLNPDIEDRFLIALETLNVFEWGYNIKWNENITALESLSLSWQDDSKLLDAAYYSSQIINRYGKEFVDKIYHCVKTYPVGTDIFLSALKRLYACSLSISINELDMVKSLADAKSIFGDSSVHQGTRTKDNILSSMKTDFNTTLEEYEVEKIGSILEKIEKSGLMPSTVLATKPKRDEESNDNKTKIISLFSENDIKAWSKVCKQMLKSDPQQFSKLFTEIVTVIDRAIALRRGFGLRNTQKISIIAFGLDLNELAKPYKGILQQMSTGEGNTIVIVVLSILKALNDEKVDIITSSSVLAKRDTDLNKDIFDLFEISVSNNCSEDKHDRQDAYSSLVVYGEIGTFQRDILLTEFYNENIIGGRDRKNVVVDEVDSMLLDRGENVLYLSHEIAGTDAMECVYTFMWSLVHSKDMIGTERDRKVVRHCMQDAMYGVISIEDISTCFQPENAVNVDLIWKILQKEKIIDHEGRLSTRSLASFSKLENIDTGNACDTGYIINMLKDTVRKGILVEVPIFLESFIDRHLDTWISNAFNAKYMEEGKHFIIDIDRTENGRGKDVNIVIMDVDTGTEQYHMQWNSGLHQFLQLKYKCAISADSLKAVFMSNISFFRLYASLYGLTGTLGSQKERDLLRDMYSVSYITIPTFQEPRFFEHDTIICKSEDNWMRSIRETAVSLSESRPVLVICETIYSCDELEKEFKRNRVKAHVYKNSYCELFILEKETELDNGCIILATNLAGRGTDIRISENISVLGGLHVILTYLPSNLRIEEQAFGRAARKGQRGSGQLIICDCIEGSHIPTEALSISPMKIQRDTTENERISKIQQRYETFIRAEEILFRKFQKYFEDLKKVISKKTDAEFQKVVLNALLDLWAFWLDSVENLLESSKHFSFVMDSLNDFLQKVNDSGVHDDSTKMISQLQNPSQLVKAGKAKISTKDYDEAQAFFDKVIRCDPSFSESALYYKVHCLLKTQSSTFDDYKIARNTFRNCKRLIQQKIEKLQNAVQTVNFISSQYTNKRETLTLSEGFVKQKENCIQIYFQILNSIDNITGYAIEPLMFVDTTCSPLDAQMIYNDLQTMEIMSRQNVRIFSQDETAWQSVEESYQLYSKEILSKLEKVKNEDHVTAADFKDVLPSREELWELLISQGILRDKTDCMLLNDTKFQEFSDILPKPIMNILNSFTDIRLVVDIAKYIFLYPDQKDKMLAKEAKLMPIDTFKKKLGFGKIYEMLQREKIISSCSFALLALDATNMVLNSKLQKFDNVGCDLFVEINGVQKETSRAIFDQLRATEIVSSDGKLLTSELGNIWLSPFSKYSSDVRNIVAKYSKYRICALYLLTELEFPIDLFSHPHEMLFKDLIDSGIVTPVKVKATVKEITEKLKFLYGYDSDKKTDKPRSRKENLQNIKKLPKILRSELNELCRGFCFSGLDLERELLDQEICKKENSKDDIILILTNDELKTTTLKQEMSQIENELKWFMSSRMKNYLNRSDIEAELDKWRDGLTKFENVDVELQSLANSFTEEQLIGLCDEMVSIANNGFGELIALTERKWTINSICKMICILAIGMIQISIAIAIEVISIGAGTFFATALLSEGIGDIMFAVECMISGHCSMQSYLQSKCFSIGISVATGGIGAMFARGAQYSRFGYKIGGQFLQKKSALELIKQGVSKRLLAKASAKRIGKKLVEVTSLKLIDTGVDFAIEKCLRGSLITLSLAITDNTIKISPETMKSLTESVSSLGRHFGKHDAEKLIEKVIRGIMFQESNLYVVLKYFGKTANMFCDGLGEAMEKLDCCGDSRIKRVSKIANIVGKIGKGLNVANAVQEVMSLKIRIIEQFEKDIKGKSLFKDQQVEIDNCNSWACLLTEKLILMANSEVSKFLVSEFEIIVVKPMLQKVGSKVQKQIYRGVSEFYRYGKKRMHQSKFRKLKAEFEPELQQSLSDIKVYLKHKYSKKLLNLLKKTRSPSLFADIVEEGIPLGIHSIQAITEITGAVISIETIGGDAITMPQTFTPTTTYLKQLGCIKLQFFVNPETGIGHFVSSKDTDGKSKNYECLLTAETGLKLERQHIAETIRSHPEIRKIIKQGIHEHFITKGGTGGVNHTKTTCLSGKDIIAHKKTIARINRKIKKAETKKDQVNLTAEKRKKQQSLKSSARDPAKKSNASKKGTGNDELFQVKLLLTTIHDSCDLHNLFYTKPTQIQFGNKAEDVDYMKAFYMIRIDTRYVVFKFGENKTLQGHSGALYFRPSDTKVQKNKNNVEKESNKGGLVIGQKEFHEKRTKAILDNYGNHLFSILGGIEKHLELLPTSKELKEMQWENCYSAIGLKLWEKDHRDQFIIGLNREKYKIWIAAKHLIESNLMADTTYSSGQPNRNVKRLLKFEKSFEELRTTKEIGLENNDIVYKQEIEKKVRSINSLESFGNVLKDPAPHEFPKKVSVIQKLKKS